MDAIKAKEREMKEEKDAERKVKPSLCTPLLPDQRP